MDDFFGEVGGCFGGLDAAADSGVSGLIAAVGW